MSNENNTGQKDKASNSGNAGKPENTNSPENPGNRTNQSLSADARNMQTDNSQQDLTRPTVKAGSPNSAEGNMRISQQNPMGQAKGANQDSNFTGKSHSSKDSAPPQKSGETDQQTMQQQKSTD